MKWDATQIGLGLTVLAAVFAITYPAWVPACPREYCPTINEYGDWLAGFVQPIALAWLIAGFWLQRRELQLQRQELKETRDELKRQADAATNSELTSRRALFISARSEAFTLLDARVDELSRLYQNVMGNSVKDPRAYQLASRIIHLWVSPDSQPHQKRLFQLLESSEFQNEVEAHKSIIRRILALAAECDGGDYPLYALTVRGAHHFGLYKLLRKLYPPDVSAHAVDTIEYLEDASFENEDRVQRS